MTTTGPMPSRPGGDDAPLTADPAAAAMQRFQRHGDRADLERALLLCAPELQQMALRLAGAGHAEDLLQDTFLVAIRGARTFLGGRLMPWLVGILQNAYRSRHRRRWARLRLLPSQHAAVDQETPEPPVTSPSPATAIDHQEWQRRIVATAEGLAEPYRTIVVQHLCAGTPLERLATQLGRSSSTVRSQLRRGLQELRRRLPTPMLGGLLAILAVREGKAMAGTAGSGSTSIATGARKPLLWLGFVAALLLGSWLLLAEGGAPESSQTPGAIAASAAASPTTLPPSDSPAAIARDRLADSASTRRLRLRLLMPNGNPVRDLPVWCDPDYVAGRSVPRVHQQWRRGQTDADGEVALDVPQHTTSVLRLHEMDLLHTLLPGELDVDWTMTVVPGNRIEFECVDTEGRPLAGATIFACGTEGTLSPGLPIARSDEFGRGLTRAALPRTNLWATAPGHRMSTKLTLFNSNDPEQAAPARFELPLAEHWVRGRVLNQQGMPIPGATVAVWSALDLGLPPFYMLTDAAGAFATEHLPRGTWHAAAIAPEYAMAARQCAMEDLTCDLVLNRGVAVTGRVIGIPGAHYERLRVTTRTLGAPLRNPLAALATTVRADGSFTLANVHPGSFLVGLLERRRDLASTRCEVGDAPPAPLELQVLPASVWQVQVVDTNGRPVHDCQIRCGSSIDLIGHKDPELAVTDVHGYARLRHPATPRHLHVHLRRNGQFDAFPIHSSQHAATREGAQITIDPKTPHGSLHGQIPEALRGGLGQGFLLLKQTGIDQRVAFDPDGIFHIEDLPPSAGWLLSWYEPNRVHVRLASFDLAPGENKHLAPIQMAPLGTVRLRLVGGTDAPPMHLHVRDDQDYQVSIDSLFPGADRELRLPAGRYRVDFAGPDGARRSRSFDVASHTTTEVDLVANAGQPCRLLVPDDTKVFNYQALLVRVMDTAAGGPIEPHAMLAKFDDGLRAWKLDITLQPGTYRALANGIDDAQHGCTITVSARPGLQTFPLARE